ncbi:MAG TPA: thiol reductase thioredoxin [Thermoanaerobaculia bacterium]|jgi:tetratricopeptide (TPR) repeat protein|nr:thiol reductase thioredoxin [Thermoanaerobaculia bacterium]
MRAFVFTDAALTRQAGRFVWLSIDTENAKNAGFLKKFPVNVWPSMFVIDGASETAAMRWVGGATTAQLLGILADGERAVRRTRGGFEQALARADRAYAEGKNADAAKGYRQAIALAPRVWPRYGRTVESLLFALEQSGDPAGCVATAREAFGRVRRSTSAVNVAGSGLGCAVELPASYPGRNELIAELERDVREVMADPKLTMSGDDRSGLYQTLIDAREDARDPAGQRQLTEEWSAFLDGAAARAKTVEQRASFDSHRLSAYFALKEPGKAVPMLEQSEKDLPDDYNPPARLALTWKEMREWDKALAASDRALAKAYGPRRLGILRTRAEIYQGKGDEASAKKTLQQAIAEAESLPEGQKNAAVLAGLKKRLDALGKPAGAS